MSAAPILVVGPRHDEEVASVVDALVAGGHAVEVVQPNDAIELEHGAGGGALRLGERTVPLPIGPAPRSAFPFRSIYIRYLFLPSSHHPLSPELTPECLRRAWFYQSEQLALWQSVIRVAQEAGVPVYNGIEGDQLELKPYRLSKMCAAGIPVPPTAHLRRAESLRTLVAAQPELVYKPLTGGTPAFVLRQDDLRPERLAQLAVAPVTFQPKIDGDDVRVFVCDGEVIACCRIDSDREVDYRGHERRIELIELPAAVTEACVRACALFRLRFSAVDLRVDAAAGAFWIFECNNHPMFAAFDRAAGAGVARALAARLAAPA